MSGHAQAFGRGCPGGCRLNLKILHQDLDPQKPSARLEEFITSGNDLTLT